MVVRVILFILFFCVSVQAEINPRRDSLRVVAFEHSFIPTTGNNDITNNIANRFVNIAISQVCQDFPAIERYDTIVTIDGTRLYSVNSDFLKLKVAFKYTVTDGQNVIIPLDYPPVEGWFEKKGGEKGSEPPFNKLSEPRYLWVFADQLYFYPTPTNADTFLIAYYAMDTTLTDDASETSVLPEYRGAVVVYTALLIAIRRVDVARVQLLQALYNEKVALSRFKEQPGRVNQ